MTPRSNDCARKLYPLLVLTALGFAAAFSAEARRNLLQPVLPEWHGERSSIHVVHPAVPYTPPKVELFIRHLVESFRLPE